MSTPGPHGRQPLAPLRRRSRTNAWQALTLRIGAAFALIAIAFMLLWFDRDGLKDNIDGHLSFVDVIYFTMITITTVGYGDIVPVSERARLIDAFLITPIRLFVWLIFLGTAYNFLFKRTWDKWRMRMIQKNLHDHVIVAGYGSSGAKAVSELLARGTPAEAIVVVDKDEDALEKAGEAGLATIHGDATRDQLLKALQIERARAMIVAVGRDDTSILIVLTARHLSQELAISVTIRAADNEDLAQQAGATTVINPVSFAGLLLAGSTHGTHIAEYLADLAAMDGRIALSERPVAPGEVGGPLGQIETGVGVRIYRDGKPFGCWEPEAKALLTGDVIIEIVHQREAPAAG